METALAGRQPEHHTGLGGDDHRLPTEQFREADQPPLHLIADQRFLAAAYG
jgi:hypothetical protein